MELNRSNGQTSPTPNWIGNILPVLHRQFGGRGNDEALRRFADLYGKFRTGDGGELQTVLKDMCLGGPGKAYADLYRSRYLAFRGSMPFDPSAQAFASVHPFDLSLDHLDRPKRCAYLIAAYLSQRLEVLAGPDDVTRSDEKISKHLRDFFSQIRRFGSPCDSLSGLRATSRLMVVFYKGAIYRLEIDPDDISASAAMVNYAVSAILVDRGNPHPCNRIPLISALDKDAAIELRMKLETDPKVAHTLKVIETALLCLALDEEKSTSPAALHMAAIQGSGFNRWYPLFGLAEFGNGHYGAIFDHALLDAAGAIGLHARVLRSASGIDFPAAFARRMTEFQLETLPCPDAAGDELLRRAAHAFERDASAQESAHARLPDVSATMRKLTPHLFPIAVCRAGVRTLGCSPEIYTSVSLAASHGGRVTGIRAAPPATARLARTWLRSGRNSFEKDVGQALSEWKELHLEAWRGRAFFTHLLLLMQLSEATGVGRWFFRHRDVAELLHWPTLISSGVIAPASETFVATPSLPQGISTIGMLAPGPIDGRMNFHALAMSEGKTAQRFVDQLVESLAEMSETLVPTTLTGQNSQDIPTKGMPADL